MARPRKSPASAVLPVHFDDYDGNQFERLVFAYHLRAYRWNSLEWYGQTGSDMGRDIWGAMPTDGSADKRICIQCANRKTFSVTKVTRDLEKVLKSISGKPDVFRVVCASMVSATARDKVKAHARSMGVHECEIWSGQEFEERLRAHSESLLQRFVDGIAFPESAPELKAFAVATEPLDDHEILGLMSRAFDRPAFRTPFQSESSLPAFRQAINDTIMVLNTGIWQTRDGKEIGRIPSRHTINDSKSRTALANIEKQLVNLRIRFEALIKAGAIKSCGCCDPECPVFMISPDAASEMDALRSSLLADFGQLLPECSIRVE